jgi:predicted nucleotidyltransferase
VDEAKRIAAAWVDEAIATDPRMLGAVLHGSVNWLRDDEELAPTSDLDILVIREPGDDTAKPGKFRYRDLLLEVSFLDAGAIASPEQVLGHYQLVGSFLGNGILADRDGALAALTSAVAAGYANPDWVEARARMAHDRMLSGFPLRHDAPVHDQVTSWLFTTGALTHVLLVATLENPTVRKRYLAVREVLAGINRLDEYEALLDLIGARRLSPERVSQHIDALERIFAAAKPVIRSPFFFAADISDDGAAVAIDGNRELVAAGSHREAIFWIVATFCRCRAVLTTDGPPGAEQPFDGDFFALLDDLGVRSQADRVRQVARSQAELPRVWSIARGIISGEIV